MMKKNILSLFIIGLGSLLLLSACDKDKLEPREPYHTIVSNTAFDQWLKQNYVMPYNIDYKYNTEDSERNHEYVMPPAKLEKAMKMARLIHYAWLGTYDEVCGKNFLRHLAPRVITTYGAWAWQRDGKSRVLATAEGGIKVELYGLNSLHMSSVDFLNKNYFHTVHHEFTHILHQNKKAPVEFNTISAEGYSPTAWQNRDEIEEYASLGFVSAYAAKNTEEDLTEVTASYITFTKAEWEELFKAAGEEGSAKIIKKIDIMKRYMKSTWNIDMDVLKEVAIRRTQEIINDKDNLILDSWKPLLSNEARAITSKSQGRAFLLQTLDEIAKDERLSSSSLNCSLITHYMSN